MSVEWIVESLVWENATGGVTSAHWRANLSSGEHGVTRYGTVGFTPDPESDGFVPLDDLTPDAVVGWVKGQLDVEEIESALTAELAVLLDPPVSTGLPWATRPASAPEPGDGGVIGE